MPLSGQSLPCTGDPQARWKQLESSQCPTANPSSRPASLCSCTQPQGACVVAGGPSE
ncbi:Hypothetical protein GSB_153248 [Giardia duodenalis]|uniref:Uncharacterized protein n=1 Tax=Giardia intestinalis TaxID=5741 RepID=V6TTS0_GIAIN|nr:Hypothetical protein GSB_153248 [Giardia intestinalis]